jgi:hypothetical protein
LITGKALTLNSSIQVTARLQESPGFSGGTLSDINRAANMLKFSDVTVSVSFKFGANIRRSFILFSFYLPNWMNKQNIEEFSSSITKDRAETTEFA